MKGLGLVALLALAAPLAARGEGFVDLRGGYTWTEDGDEQITFISFFGPFFAVSSSVEFEGSGSAGLRAGYWFESLPALGLALHASWFAPSSTLDVIPASPLLLIRVPLAGSDEFPHGRVQPFAGVGPGVFITLDDTGGASNEEVDVGLDAQAGLRVLVTPNVALFAEYRYTSFEAQLDFFGLETDLESHHGTGGIGFHF